MLTRDIEKTTLSGKFSREINCLPVWTEETKYILRTMNDDAMKPKASTSIINSFDPSGVIQAGAHVSNDKFSNLVVSDHLSPTLQDEANEDSARLRIQRRPRNRKRKRQLDYHRASCGTVSSTATKSSPTGPSKLSSRP